MTDTPSAAPSPIPCGDCGMQCTPGEYHPYAACLMFRACGDSTVVRANLDAVRAQPTPPAVVEPMTPIRAAAFDLYTPPFRHEHGYIRDSNHQMVADDAGDTMVGVIAARIRGWGRIQYMDNPEGRAGALQDEVAEMVADALNRYWAAHGIGIKKENGNA